LYFVDFASIASSAERSEPARKVRPAPVSTAARGPVDDDRDDGVERVRYLLNSLLYLCAWVFLCTFDAHMIAVSFDNHHSFRCIVFVRSGGEEGQQNKSV